jgi:hypothetical protein
VNTHTHSNRTAGQSVTWCYAHACQQYHPPKCSVLTSTFACVVPKSSIMDVASLRNWRKAPGTTFWVACSLLLTVAVALHWGER